MEAGGLLLIYSIKYFISSTGIVITVEYKPKKRGCKLLLRDKENCGSIVRESGVGEEIKKKVNFLQRQ